MSQYLPKSEWLHSYYLKLDSEGNLFCPEGELQKFLICVRYYNQGRRLRIQNNFDTAVLKLIGDNVELKLAYNMVDCVTLVGENLKIIPGLCDELTIHFGPKEIRYFKEICKQKQRSKLLQPRNLQRNRRRK